MGLMLCCMPRRNTVAADIVVEEYSVETRWDGTKWVEVSRSEPKSYTVPENEKVKKVRHEPDGEEGIATNHEELSKSPGWISNTATDEDVNQNTIPDTAHLVEPINHVDLAIAIMLTDDQSNTYDPATDNGELDEDDTAVEPGEPGAHDAKKEPDQLNIQQAEITADKPQVYRSTSTITFT